MKPFFRKLLSKKESRVTEFINTIKRISILTNDISKQKSKLADLEYELIIQNKNEVFISLGDFLEIMNKNDISIQDIITRCRHLSELNTAASSFINVYSIVEDDHLVLCPDVETCDRHKDYSGEKIKITTARILHE